MSHQPPLKVEVENLGPIRNGAVDLRPLTVLIGQNNSGKSYFAQLLYALFKALRERVPLSPYPLVDRTHDLANRALYGFLSRATQSSPSIKLSDIPSGLLPGAVESYRSIQGELTPAIDGALREYFGVDDLSGIIRSGHAKQSLSIRLGNDFLSYSVAADGSTFAKLSPSYPGAVDVSRDDLDSFRQAGVQPAVADWAKFVATKMWLETLDANDMPGKRLFYIPAYRAGLLQTLDVLVRLSLRALTVDWVRSNAAQITVRPSGILADFLDQITSAGSIHQIEDVGPIQPALSLLEGKLLEGTAAIGDVTKGEGVLLYHQGKQAYPLSLTSSMVAELAPLDILIHRWIRPGDLVVIDEPEAHLHPENQRLIARVIVRLVRAGVRVVCPTHSSLLLHQISNHLLASSASRSLQSRLGFADSDVINEDDVAVYLFARTKQGTEIHPVPIEPGFGISEDEFLRVVEEIGAESFALSEAFLSTHPNAS